MGLVTLVIVFTEPFSMDGTFVKLCSCMATAIFYYLAYKKEKEQIELEKFLFFDPKTKQKGWSSDFLCCMIWLFNTVFHLICLIYLVHKNGLLWF